MRSTFTISKLLTATVLIWDCGVGVDAAPFVYELAPVMLTDVDTGDEYTVTGTITTSCNHCTLSSSEIVAYDVHVAGFVAFNFLETNLGQVVFARDALASPTQLFLSVPGPQQNPTLTLAAFEDAGLQQMTWQRDYSGIARVTYLNIRYPNIVNARFATPHNSKIPFVIATFVPEPSAIVLGAFGALILWRSKQLR